MFYIYAFFAQFPSFPYNPFCPFIEEFHRMCQWFGWTRDQRLLAYDSFQLAIITQFNAAYGVDVDNLASWQLLCLVLGIDPVPADLKTCRKVKPHSVACFLFTNRKASPVKLTNIQRVLTTYVNIYDLLAFPISGAPKIFPTEVALSKYSIKNNKVFPKKQVEPNSLLCALLRHIAHPSREPKRKGGS